MLCQHLEGYSIRGLRKRDYPPAMYHQQPWWNGYEKFIDGMSRVGRILCEGEERVSTLLLHPMTTAWIYYNDRDREKIDVLHEQFLSVIKTLEQKHIEFHLGDESIMERHAFVEDGCIVIGNQKYNTIVMSPHEKIFPSTEKLISEFQACGGNVVQAEDLADAGIIDNKNITYTRRMLDKCPIYYFVNSSPKEEKANLCVEGRKLDIYSGELQMAEKEHVFEPWGSLMIVEDGTKSVPAKSREAEYLYPTGKFKVCGKVENTLLLDRCDYYFDGELQEKNGYVLNITERANKLGGKVAIRQDYHVRMDFVPQSIHLVCETPEKFQIFVNGTEISKEICGSYVDISFKRIEIAKYLHQGENIITFCCDFIQSEEFYQRLEKAYLFESEKNKLSYDMELEAVMLVGDFSVQTSGKWERLEHNACRYQGEFIIAKPVEELELSDIQKQGFPFFCGSLKVEKEVKLTENSVLKVNRKGVNVLAVEIDGKGEVVLTGNGEINIGSLADEGVHTLKLTLINNLRNLLGPHHLKEGECFVVCPSSFYQEPCVWNPDEEETWDENYCFVEFGI